MLLQFVLTIIADPDLFLTDPDPMIWTWINQIRVTKKD